MAKEKCRVCLSEGILTNIFNTESNPMISTKIMSLAKVEIYQDDGLPNTICFGCIEMLNKCFEFVQKIVTSDLKLRTKLFKNPNTNEDPVEADDKTCIDNDNIFLNDDIKFSPKSEDIKKLPIHENTNFKTNQYLKENVPLKEECEKLNIKINCSNLKGNSGKKSQKEQCFTCGKVMSSRFRLKTHLRTHTGERPFSCPYCNKNFSLSQNLKVHIRIHTGEKPLQCKICGETFAQSAGLAAHRRKHTGQTPYRCTLCPRSFRTIGHLQYHIRRHTGEKNFECEICGRAFITRSDLKQHLLTHSGDRRHVCCVCGVRLTRASHLKRHIQNTHNGEKSFLCTQCPSKFTQKVDFEKHKKKHAKTEENT